MKRWLASVLLISVGMSALPCELLEALSEGESAVAHAFDGASCVHLEQTPTERLPESECVGCLCCTAVSCLSMSAPAIHRAPTQRGPLEDAPPDLDADEHADGVFHPPRPLA